MTTSSFHFAFRTFSTSAAQGASPSYPFSNTQSTNLPSLSDFALPFYPTYHTSYDPCGRFADMLRRIASLGQQASQDLEHMPPLPGDEAQPADAKSSGGFAGVFRGLTIKSKSPPLSLQHHHQQQQQQQRQQPSPSRFEHRFLADRPSSLDRCLEWRPTSKLRGLPADHVEWFDQLRTGSLNERIAAASSLRSALADYPLNPVRHIARGKNT